MSITTHRGKLFQEKAFINYADYQHYSSFNLIS